MIDALIAGRDEHDLPGGRQLSNFRDPREIWGHMPVAAVDADALGLASGLQSNAQWMI
jgi:hypothetical protein